MTGGEVRVLIERLPRSAFGDGLEPGGKTICLS